MSLPRTRVAIIGALPEELEKLKTLLSDIKELQHGPFQYQECKFEDIDCLLSLSGP